MVFQALHCVQKRGTGEEWYFVMNESFIRDNVIYRERKLFQFTVQSDLIKYMNKANGGQIGGHL